MFKRSKEPEKKGSEKREDLLVSFLKDAHFVFAIIFFRKSVSLRKDPILWPVFQTDTLLLFPLGGPDGRGRVQPLAMARKGRAWGKNPLTKAEPRRGDVVVENY